MKFNQKNYYCLFLILINFFNFQVKAQTAKASLDLNRDEKMDMGFYSKDNGFWLITSTNSIAISPLFSCNLYKYSPKLDKQEWKTEMKNVDSGPIFDKKNPNYIYFQKNGYSSLFLSAPHKVHQIDNKGKLRIVEIENDKDKNRDIGLRLATFTTMNSLCALYIHKKEQKGFFIAQYDNETLKLTVKAIELPANTGKQEFSEWSYGGVSENTVLLYQHDLDKEYRDFVNVILIDITKGVVSSKFTYQPISKNKPMNIIPSYDYITNAYRRLFPPKDRAYDPVLENMIDTGYGRLRISEDGTKIFHYALLSKSKLTSKRLMSELENFGTPSGFVLAQLDLKGKLISQTETLFKDPKDVSDMSAHGVKTLIFNEQYDGQLCLELYIVALGKIARYSKQFDETGKEATDCTKKNKIKIAYFAGQPKTSAATIDELFPCFMENEDKVRKYIETKKFDGNYSVYPDEGSVILSVEIPKERALGLMLFEE